MDATIIHLTAGTVLRGEKYEYVIKEVLGTGTFGITYRATIKLAGALGALSTGVDVALKEFFMKQINGRNGTEVTVGGSDWTYEYYKGKFASEAKNLSALKHPNIINVLELFEANGTFYYSMEFMPGGSLDALIEKKGKLSADETVSFTKQIGAALSYMHSKRMLHLDLKPGNVMLNANGEAVLIDFGLAKHFSADGSPETSTSVGLGTPGYAPIEQATYKEGEGFPATMDVYALGACMYKMLTGVRPPAAADVFNDGLEPPTEDEALASCVLKALAPSKKDRFQSVREMLSELDGGDVTPFIEIDEDETIPNIISKPSAPKSNNRSKLLIYIIVAIAIIAIGVTAVLLSGGHSEETVIEQNDGITLGYIKLSDLSINDSYFEEKISEAQKEFERRQSAINEDYKKLQEQSEKGLITVSAYEAKAGVLKQRSDNLSAAIEKKKVELEEERQVMLDNVAQIICEFLKQNHLSKLYLVSSSRPPLPLDLYADQLIWSNDIPDGATDFTRELQSFLDEALLDEQTAFLNEVKKETGVKTTSSGLVYKITKKGNGVYPKSDSDVVVVNYKGYFKDGTSFDADDNISFSLQYVIKGFSEGLKLIDVGGKARLYIPYELGYGENGYDKIPPKSTLIFDVELLDVNPIDVMNNAG